jgi:hypothetical protein
LFSSAITNWSTVCREIKQRRTDCYEETNNKQATANGGKRSLPWALFVRAAQEPEPKKGWRYPEPEGVDAMRAGVGPTKT